MKSGEGNLLYYWIVLVCKGENINKMCDKLCRTQLRIKLDQKESKRWHFEFQELKLHFITVVSMGVKTPSMITKVFIISITASSKAPLTSSLATEDPFMRSLSNFKIYIVVFSVTYHFRPTNSTDEVQITHHPSSDKVTNL